MADIEAELTLAGKELDKASRVETEVLINEANSA